MKTIYLLVLLFMSSTCFADITFEDDYTHSNGFTKGMKAFEIGDYETAIDIWTNLSYPGILDFHDADRGSQYELGKMYLYGVGVEIDTKKALNLIQESANKNYSPSQFLIGLLYDEGKVLPKNNKKALKWITKSASWKNDDAIAWLAADVASKIQESELSSNIPKLNYGNYHALIIGNDEYMHFKPLSNAVNDANDVANVLKTKYNFKVDLLTNATRDETIEALSSLRRSISNQDNVLIYYAGHGDLDKDVDEGVWFPIDATENSEVNWIPNSDIIRSVRAMKAKHVIVVADSCFSGTLTRAANIKENGTIHIKKLVEKKARKVLTSGGEEPVSDTGGGGNSIFAAIFLKILNENRGVLEGNELFTKLRKQVNVNSDQNPQYGDISKAGHDGGDFLFVRQQ